MPTDTLIEITYLVATVLFILSLKWLSSPTTARHGVWAGEIGMAPGSLLVDLAAERGGNCELTQGGEKINVNGVTIIGLYNLASTVPYNASQMYARNLTAFLLLMVKDGKLQIDTKDDIIRETLLTQGGEVVNPRLREFFKLPALATTGGA